ncbi:MAG: class I SAM-dependent methyltransferase [bacterium]|nr:class I SAM-dependent methyltransferase [bacterium]
MAWYLVGITIMDIQEYSKHFELESKHFWFEGRRIILAKRLKHILKDKNIKILDGGCGTGSNFSCLTDYGIVFGADNSRIAIQFAKKQNKKLVASTIENLPFKQNAFDIIVLLDVLEHIELEHSALLTIKKTLKNKGYLIITVPAFNFLWSSHDKANHHKRRYTYIMLKRTLQQAGFHIEKLSYISFFLFPFIFTVRVIRNFCFLKKTTSDLAPANNILNNILIFLYYIEAWLLEYISFPFGTSLLCIAQKY